MAGLIVDRDLQDLREKTDIVEVISGHMKLRKTGRVFKGLCCFHQEKTPSFTVDPGKQLYHCFGCGNGGDVFTFLRQVEGLSFTEAAERLAASVGVTLRYEGGSERSDGARAPLLEATTQAARFFSERLRSAPDAEAARRYLEGRGFSPQDATDWGLGFAPGGRDVLYRHLLGLKFTSKQIIDAGLAYVTDAGEHRDRFRGRVIFPVADLSGHVVGFGARALGEEQPKYLNSPETSVYRKAKLLFGLDKARADIVRKGVAVVTEGYTDVIALHKVGITTAVATCGTALGEEHFAVLKRFCDKVTLAFDADPAGAVASERGFGIHAKMGLEVLVAPLPEGKDPADVALSEGAEVTEKVLGEAEPLMRFVLERTLQGAPLDTPGSKAKAVSATAAILAWEPNRVARSDYVFWLARRIGVDPLQIQQEISEVQSDPSRRGPSTRVERLPGHVKVEREALALVIDSPAELKRVSAWVTGDHFTVAEHRVVLNVLLEYSRSGEGSFMDGLPDDETRRLAAELALSQLTTQDPEEVFLRLEEFRLRRQIASLRTKLDRLDPDMDPDGYAELFAELMKLDEQRRRFDLR